MVPVEMTTVHMANVPGIDRVVAEVPKPEIPPSCLDLFGCLFTLVVLPVNFDGWRVVPSHHGSECHHPDITLDSGYVHRCRLKHVFLYVISSFSSWESRPGRKHGPDSGMFRSRTIPFHRQCLDLGM